MWWRQKQQLCQVTKTKKMWRAEAEGCRGAPCCHIGGGGAELSSPSSKTRRVKLDRTKIISSKPTNRKKIVDQRRGDKNIGNAKRAGRAGGTHRCDRKTRAIRHHDG
jgi:hypothetical protein